MKLSKRQLYQIADKAHSLILDYVGEIGYPSTRIWQQAMTEILQKDGYEIYLKHSDGDNITFERLELPKE